MVDSYIILLGIDPHSRNNKMHYACDRNYLIYVHVEPMRLEYSVSKEAGDKETMAVSYLGWEKAVVFHIISNEIIWNPFSSINGRLHKKYVSAKLVNNLHLHF